MGRYRPPGVYAQEEVRSIAPSPVPNADIIAIVSEVPPAAPFAERIVLDGLTATQLTKKGIDADSIEVYSRDESTKYVAADDYTVTAGGSNEYTSFHSVAREANSVTDETHTLSNTVKSFSLNNGRGVHDLSIRTTTPSKTYVEYQDYVYDQYHNKVVALTGTTLPTDGTQILATYKYGIEDEEEVLVKYNYADEEYYSRKLLQDESEIFALYGYPFKTDGSPNPMSLAAWLAFTNGGPQTQVLAVPVNPHSTNRLTNTVPELPEWQEAFDSIVEDVSIVLETSGKLEYHGLAYSHVLGASQYNQERIAILGRDGTKTPAVTKTQLRDQAKAFNSKRVVLISPSVWETVDTVNGKTVALGAQYAAAALAGRLSLYNPQDTMTRKPIVNIRTGVIEAEPVMNEDAAAGLLVCDNKSGFMRVRHSITTASANVNTRELNVVRAQDFMIRSMRETLDRSVIGMLMEPDVDFLVQGAVTNILDRMKNAYVIADYQSPQVFQDTSDPTRLRVRFSYLPNYAVNEISIEFSITPFGATVVT
jgi:hypothetical protein